MSRPNYHRLLCLAEMEGKGVRGRGGEEKDGNTKEEEFSRLTGSLKIEPCAAGPRRKIRLAWKRRQWKNLRSEKIRAMLPTPWNF